jgi:DNA-binding XRE family transcriptional regulator
MQYHVRLEKEGRSWNAIFADAPGCATYGRSRAQAMAAAREALEGWLEAHLVDGRSPPRPARTARNAEPVEVDPQLGLAIELRWARQEAGLSQAELASRVGVSQQQIAKLERPGANPSIATLRKVAAALGVRVQLELVA